MNDPLFWVVLSIELVVLSGLIIFAIFGFFQLLYFRHAPYVATTDASMDAMFRLANVKQGTHIIELGSGNGEISIRAAEAGAFAHGYETNPVLAIYARHRANQRNVGDRVRIEQRDFFQTTLPGETDVVFAYLLPETMDHLWPKLKRELRPGAIIISNAFAIHGVEPEARDGKVIKYRIPGAS